MGDCGSNLLGLLLGAVIVEGSLKTNALVALVVPLVVLAVPFLDTASWWPSGSSTGRPVYRADANHFHHRFRRIGFSQRRTVLYLYGWTLTWPALALAVRFVPYSDDRGHLNRLDRGDGRLLRGRRRASVYLVYVLEILKLRRLRAWQLRHARPRRRRSTRSTQRSSASSRPASSAAPAADRVRTRSEPHLAARGGPAVTVPHRPPRDARGGEQTGMTRPFATG